MPPKSIPLHRRQMLITTAGLVTAALLGSVTLTIVKDQRWATSADYRRLHQERQASTLVVCYSRSGHSLNAAKAVAAVWDADLAVLRCERYPRNVRGQWQASQDAQAGLQEVPVEGLPTAEVLARYVHVILVGPTWWFRPAVPLWMLAQQTSWQGQSLRVLLTGNSRVSDDALREFSAVLQSRGAQVVSQAFIARGRVWWQRSSEEVQAHAQAIARQWAKVSPLNQG